MQDLTLHQGQNTRWGVDALQIVQPEGKLQGQVGGDHCERGVCCGCVYMCVHKGQEDGAGGEKRRGAEPEGVDTNRIPEILRTNFPLAPTICFEVKQPQALLPRPTA